MQGLVHQKNMLCPSRQICALLAATESGSSNTQHESHCHVSRATEHLLSLKVMSVLFSKVESRSKNRKEEN
jgi:hypothetical protein